MRGARWLDAGIMQSILAGIRLRPSFAVNVADPHQDLLPLTSGLLNFLAADEVDSWRIAIAADHHPRRGARAPGRHDHVTLPYLVPSEYVAEAVRAAEETVVDAGAESSHCRRIWRTRSAPVWVPGWCVRTPANACRRRSTATTKASIPCSPVPVTGSA